RPPFSSFSVFIIARPLVVVNKHFVEALGQERRSFSLNRAKTLTSGHFWSMIKIGRDVYKGEGI
ncbi:MAG: hypothetical protein IJ344_00660, partial [Clostridia bacterium]|nr:hypothetical protein [Clostridia bacterium]